MAIDKKVPISYLNRRKNAVLDKWSDLPVSQILSVNLSRCKIAVFVSRLLERSHSETHCQLQSVSQPTTKISFEMQNRQIRISFNINTQIEIHAEFRISNSLHINDRRSLARLDYLQDRGVDQAAAVDEDGHFDVLAEDYADGDLDEVADALHAIDYPAGVVVFLVTDGANEPQDGAD